MLIAKQCRSGIAGEAKQVTVGNDTEAAGRSRVALVTGGTRGIGREIAASLAVEGMVVYITGRDGSVASAVAGELSRDGADVRGLELEVTEAAAAESVVAAIAMEHGGVDILVNNAAVELDLDHGALEADLESAREMFEVDVIAPWRLMQLVAPAMLERGWGRIVNVTTGLAQFERMVDSRRDDHFPGHGGYRVCKAALNALTALTAGELIETGVLVNAADPGYCQTDMGSPQAPFTARDGADISVFLATLEDDGPSGGWFFQRASKDW